MSHEQRSTEPQDRLTRICDAMTNALEAHPEASGTEKAAIFLDDDGRGGLVLHGWDDDTDAMVHLFMHFRAIMRANGKDIEFIGIPESPAGLT